VGLVTNQERQFHMPIFVIAMRSIALSSLLGGATPTLSLITQRGML
jgi:hypothetical protein